MLSELLFFLFYLKLSDLYFVNQNSFRAFHCTSLALLSLKNTVYYGMSLIDIQNPIQKIFSITSNTSSDVYNIYNIYNDYDYDYNGYYLKVIVLYFYAYILYDLKHCYKRYDLFMHHIVCLPWVFLNYKQHIGFMSFVIMAEGVTFAYFITAFNYQLVYRLLFTFIVRFPIWIMCIYNIYSHSFSVLSLLDLFNVCVLVFMFGMDCLWSSNNFKKLKQLPSAPSSMPSAPSSMPS